MRSGGRFKDSSPERGDAQGTVNASPRSFLHTGHGRGAVLYRRYDGHYGLITSVEEAL